MNLLKIMVLFVMLQNIELFDKITKISGFVCLCRIRIHDEHNREE